MTGNNVIPLKKHISINKTIHKEVHQCILAVLEIGAVPKGEEDFVFSVAEEVARQYKETTKPYKLKLTVEQFSCLWTVLKTVLDLEATESQNTASLIVYAFGEIGDILDKELSLIKANEIKENCRPADLGFPSR